MATVYSKDGNIRTVIDTVEQEIDQSDFGQVESVVKWNLKNISKSTVPDTLVSDILLLVGDVLHIVLNDNSVISYTVTDVISTVPYVIDTTSVTMGEIPSKVYKDTTTYTVNDEPLVIFKETKEEGSLELLDNPNFEQDSYPFVENPNPTVITYWEAGRLVVEPILANSFDATLGFVTVIPGATYIISLYDVISGVYGIQFSDSEVLDNRGVNLYSGSVTKEIIPTTDKLYLSVHSTVSRLGDKMYLGGISVKQKSLMVEKTYLPKIVTGRIVEQKFTLPIDEEMMSCTCRLFRLTV